MNNDSSEFKSLSENIRLTEMEPMLWFHHQGNKATFDAFENVTPKLGFVVESCVYMILFIHQKIYKHTNVQQMDIDEAAKQV